MTAAPPTLHRKPKADTETVEELVGRVLHGVVRVPSFQRGLRWDAKDVIALFDSIYRGYPIGSLLLWQRAAAAVHLCVGPVEIDAPETSSAWWVVDGQQRLTALTASLARPEPIPATPDDPYVVYFDPSAETFHSPPSSGDIPSIWVPLPILLDASRLSEWMFDWEHGREREIRKKIFETGKRIREYPIPLYIVDTDDEDLLREIFYRINNSGRQLKWEEVHDALFGARASSPSTLDELTEELAAVGLGRPASGELLQCLLAWRGLDVTRSLAEHRRRDREVLRDAVPHALPALRRVLSFLRRDAEIPHLRLLPRSLPLLVLVRFLELHPQPNARTRELLVRWVWRSFLSSSHDERTLRRHAVARVDPDDEEGSAQALLELVPKTPNATFEVPARFDARAAASRIALLALASLGPRGLTDEHLLDVAALLETQDAFRPIVRLGKAAPELARSPANRMLHPGKGIMRTAILERIADAGTTDRVLLSHGITAEAADQLVKGEHGGFLDARRRVIANTVTQLGERLAGWSRSDRPSIHYLLRRTEAEP